MQRKFDELTKVLAGDLGAGGQGACHNVQLCASVDKVAEDGYVEDGIQW